MSFEEKFPSLESFGVEDPDWDGEYPQYIDVVIIEDIQEYCIDKQRVREAIKKCWDLQKNWGEKDLFKFLEDFEKELGLNG